MSGLGGKKCKSNCPSDLCEVDVDEGKPFNIMLPLFEISPESNTEYRVFLLKFSMLATIDILCQTPPK